MRPLDAFRQARSVLDEFLSDAKVQDAVEQFVGLIVGCFESGGKILIAGNGGSMADAMHFAEEWTGKFCSVRPPYPAMALCDPTHLTCVANDFGFREVFSRPIQAFAQPGDLVILLSTSGASENLLLAADAAYAKGARIVGLLGRRGGPLLSKCDLPILAPGQGSDRIQEIHMLILHAVIEAAELALLCGQSVEN